MTPIHLLLLAGGAYAGLALLFKIRSEGSTKKVLPLANPNALVETIVYDRIGFENGLNSSEGRDLSKAMDAAAESLATMQPGSDAFREANIAFAEEFLNFVLSRTRDDLGAIPLVNLRVRGQQNLVNNMVSDVRAVMREQANKIRAGVYG